MTTYGLIGRTLGHSFSAAFFTHKFTTEQIQAEYKNFELKTIDELPALLDANPGIKGLNVTIPYKQSVIQYLDEIDNTAANIGAVNTVKIGKSPTGQRYLTGYNTDAPGFLESLSRLTCHLPAKALILGATGGAAAAVAHALHSIGIQTTGVSRNPIQNQISYTEITPAIIATHQLIVNCTPLGTYPEITRRPPIPYQLITPIHIAYDLVYNPAQTAFLKACAAQGATTINGQAMLQAQAKLAYAIWTTSPTAHNKPNLAIYQNQNHKK